MEEIENLLEDGVLRMLNLVCACENPIGERIGEKIAPSL